MRNIFYWNAPSAAQTSGTKIFLFPLFSASTINGMYQWCAQKKTCRFFFFSRSFLSAEKQRPTKWKTNERPYRQSFMIFFFLQNYIYLKTHKNWFFSITLFYVLCTPLNSILCDGIAQIKWKEKKKTKKYPTNRALCTLFYVQ